jgi:hypothetical protein
LLKFSDPLVDYVETLISQWKTWGDSEQLRPELMKRMGDTLVDFIADDSTRSHFVSKMPSPKNISNFFRFFPRSQLIVLVRDGRSTTESRVRSFGETYETAMTRWRDGAIELLKFRKSLETNPESSSRVHWVRYEDVVEDVEAEVGKILDFVNLDGDRFDRDKAFKMPVLGSSTFGRSHAGDLNWTPTQRDETFQPLERWNEWPASLHRRFNWVCGDLMRAHGYDNLVESEKKSWVKNRVIDSLKSGRDLISRKKASLRHLIWAT